MGNALCRIDRARVWTDSAQPGLVAKTAESASQRKPELDLLRGRLLGLAYLAECSALAPASCSAASALCSAGVVDSGGAGAGPPQPMANIPKTMVSNDREINFFIKFTFLPKL